MNLPIESASRELQFFEPCTERPLSVPAAVQQPRTRIQSVFEILLALTEWFLVQFDPPKNKKEWTEISLSNL